MKSQNIRKPSKMQTKIRTMSMRSGITDGEMFVCTYVVESVCSMNAVVSVC